jgi:hypothetical protein
MKLIKLAAASALITVVGVAQAALLDRGGGLIYDDVLNITWLQDASSAATNTFGLSGISSEGTMSWNTAKSWVQAMNATQYLGYSDWRLPIVKPINVETGFNYSTSYDGTTDTAWNITSTASELSYMYYVNLGLSGIYNSLGEPSQVFGVFNNGQYGVSGQRDVGLVRNLSNGAYWTGTAYEYSPTDIAWHFFTMDGLQSVYRVEDYSFTAWAVRDGDVAVSPVPAPPAFLLMLTGLGLLGLTKRFRKEVKQA